MSWPLPTVRPTRCRRAAKAGAERDAGGRLPSSSSVASMQWLARLPIALARPVLRSQTRPRVSPASRPKAASSVLLPKRQRAPATGQLVGSSCRTASTLPLVWFQTGSTVVSARCAARDCACAPDATPQGRASGQTAVGAGARSWRGYDRVGRSKFPASGTWDYSRLCLFNNLCGRREPVTAGRSGAAIAALRGLANRLSICALVESVRLATELATHDGLAVGHGGLRLLGRPARRSIASTRSREHEQAKRSGLPPSSFGRRPRGTAGAAACSPDQSSSSCGDRVSNRAPARAQPSSSPASPGSFCSIRPAAACFVGGQQQPRRQLLGLAEVVLERAGQRIRFQRDQALVAHRVAAVARRVLDGDRQHRVGAEFAQVARDLACLRRAARCRAGCRQRCIRRTACAARRGRAIAPTAARRPWRGR